MSEEDLLFIHKLLTDPKIIEAMGIEYNTQDRYRVTDKVYTLLSKIRVEEELERIKLEIERWNNESI